jgi:predicted P-loop ATPase
MALDKDALTQLRCSWVYEWAELENVFGRHAVARVKAFLTSTEDKYRPPFGRNTVSVKRSGVIVGTTNNDDFLHDPTGSRRFWVIPIGRIDSALLQAQRDQLLAEAVSYYRAGDRYWLDEAEEKQRQALADMFVETDPWDARVIEFAGDQVRVRLHDILFQALSIPLEKMTRRDEMRVANILKRAHYESDQRRIEGKVTRFWVHSGS